MFTSTTSAIHLNNGCIEVNFIGKAARRIIKRDYIPAVFIFSQGTEKGLTIMVE